ncbi:hypothetical protein, partial [Salmonella sp. s54836]|uniref:hypothetical protein n=1 Tax=Salmonella sp. s54836 TaxID=3159673 RepID=UPI0039807BF0
MRQFGKNKLRYPWGIAVHNNNLYVTDVDSCTNKPGLHYYTLTGQLLNTTFQTRYFAHPLGVHVNTNCLVFICDCDNHCIPVFNEHFQHQRTISHENIKYPHDIK